ASSIVVILLGPRSAIRLSSRAGFSPLSVLGQRLPKRKPVCPRQSARRGAASDHKPGKPVHFRGLREIFRAAASGRERPPGNLTPGCARAYEPLPFNGNPGRLAQRESTPFTRAG